MKPVDEELDRACQRNDCQAVRDCLRRGAEPSGHRGEYRGCFPLHRAAFNNNKDIVELLLQHGARGDVEDQSCELPLHKAAAKGGTDVLPVLLGVTPDKNKQNQEGDTALHKAVENYQTEAVRLLAPLTDLTIRNRRECSPLDTAIVHDIKEIAEILIQNGASGDLEDNCGNLALHTAAANGRQAILSCLLSVTTDKNKQNESGDSALLVALQYNQAEAVRVLAPVSDLSIVDNRGDLVLHKAAVNGRFKTLSTVISFTPDKNKQNAEGDTALHQAVKNSKTEAVSLLAPLSDLNITNRSGDRPLDIAIRQDTRDIALILIQNGASGDFEDVFGNLHLHTAAAKGRSTIVSALITVTTDKNKQNQDGDTALHQAVEQGQTEAVRLLAPLIDLTIRNNKGETIADLAFKQKIQDIRNILIRDFDVLRNLALKGEDVNKIYRDGCTAIFYTAQAGNYNTTKILLEQGADIDRQNDSGDTPLHVAAEEGHVGIINLLIEFNPLQGKVNKNGETPFDKAFAKNQDEASR